MLELEPLALAREEDKQKVGACLTMRSDNALKSSVEIILKLFNALLRFALFTRSRSDPLSSVVLYDIFSMIVRLKNSAYRN
jgi:hypothetical protein